jgi:hypothetical protein
MRRKRHFEKIVARENDQRDRLAVLLESLRRDAGFLEANIADEEHRTGKRDPSHYSYPIRARTMVQRRDNLKATIAALELRLAAA